MRRAHALVLLAAFLITGHAAIAQTGKPSAQSRALALTAKPIAYFSRSEPDRVRFGSLEFLGGLVLESKEEEFGGISGIAMLDEASNEFLAVTDRARWIRGKLVIEGRRLTGLTNAAIAPMLDGTGAPLHTGASYDTESIALGEIGQVYVGIERVHRVVRFDFGKQGFGARSGNVAVPRSIKSLPRNQGIEGLIYVPKDRPLGGALLAFSEKGLDGAENFRGFILGGAAPGEFSVRRIGEFNIVDAALIPGGDVVILERYFSLLGGLAMRMRLIRLADIKPGATLDGPVLIEAGGGYQIDNMEGIAAHRTADGETILTVVSDDNFTWLQRTLLLRFALAGE